MRLQFWKKPKGSDTRLARLSIADTDSANAFWEQLSHLDGTEKVAAAANVSVDELVEAIGVLTAHECRYAHQRVFRGHLLDILVGLTVTAVVLLVLLDTVLVGTRVLPSLQVKPTLVAARAIRADEPVNGMNTRLGFSRFTRVCFAELPPSPLAAVINIQPGRPICDNIVRAVKPGGASK